MTLLDWLVVVITNGLIVAYGFRIARGTKESSDWLLAARGLPWWMVGLSMFATAVDSGDYVAVVGGAYTFGFSNLTNWWLGLPLGWSLVAYMVFLPLYRGGMMTNAEYLEYRFGPSVRLLSALIQLQYRTNVLGNIAFSLYLTFSILTGWGQATWWLVALIAASAAAYTATGGLKAVAVTDALQSIVMALSSLVLWLVLWNAVGGWTGLHQRLYDLDPNLVQSMLHVGGQGEPGVPAWMVVFGWVTLLTAYCVVNHSQAMRLLAARSEWDMQMAAFVASVVTAAVMWFNITLGVLGRAVIPALPRVDEIYPRLVQDYLSSGLVGLVVAGVLAGGVSTYDSISSALAAIFTRDIYARFLVKRRSDHHYLQVSRWATPVIIAASFAYVPFLHSGMLAFHLRITSVAVVPLLAIYLLGTLTRVHRSSGAAGLAAGVAYGLSSFFGDLYGWGLPLWWTNSWWAYLWSLLVTAVAMIAVSAVKGWATEEEVQGLVYFSAKRREGAWASPARLKATEGTWLESSHEKLLPMPGHPFGDRFRILPWYIKPALWMAAFLLGIGYITLVVLW